MNGLTTADPKWDPLLGMVCAWPGPDAAADHRRVKDSGQFDVTDGLWKPTPDFHDEEVSSTVFGVRFSSPRVLAPHQQCAWLRLPSQRNDLILFV